MCSAGMKNRGVWRGRVRVTVKSVGTNDCGEVRGDTSPSTLWRDYYYCREE